MLWLGGRGHLLPQDFFKLPWYATGCSFSTVFNHKQGLLQHLCICGRKCARPFIRDEEVVTQGGVKSPVKKGTFGKNGRAGHRRHCIKAKTQVLAEMSLRSLRQEALAQKKCNAMPFGQESNVSGLAT